MKKTFISVLAIVIVLIIAGYVGTSLMIKPANQVSSAEASIKLANFNGSSVEVGSVQKIQWTSSNYKSSSVGINIIRKVSDNPARYVLVRTVSTKTANDGNAVWVPAKTDIGANTLVELDCQLSAQACRSSVSNATLAVVDTGKNANTAAAYQAIESANNK